MKLARRRYATPDTLRRELSDIYQRAIIYSTIWTAQAPLSIHGRPLPAVSEASLQRLREWGDVPTRPLSLEAILRWTRTELSAEELNQVITLIEALLVRRWIVGVPPNDLRSAFSRVMQNISSSTNFISDTKTILAEERFRFPSDEALRRSFIEQPVYKRGATYTALILKAIAMNRQGLECPSISMGTSSGSYSIEHILPRTLPSEWITDLNSWGEANPQQLFLDRGDTFGNLTLTAYNSSLSNRRFSEKQRLVEDNLYLKISREILDNTKWTQAEIEDRSRQMAEQAVEIWPGI